MPLVISDRPSKRAEPNRLARYREGANCTWRAIGAQLVRNVCDGGHLRGHGAWRLAPESELLRGICVARSVEFRLRFAFWGYTPPVFAKSEKVVWNDRGARLGKNKSVEGHDFDGVAEGLLTSCGGT